MDEEGWVSIEQLLVALHRSKKWEDICEADLNNVIEKSEKKRHDSKPCLLMIAAKMACDENKSSNGY